MTVSLRPAQRAIRGSYSLTRDTQTTAETYCRRCCRRYTDRARELEMVHTCPACIERQEALRSA